MYIVSESRNLHWLMFDTPRLPFAVEWSHRFLSDAVRPGAYAVDATAGNGKDALFLARLVGDRGRVFAFDVQSKALDATRRLFLENGITEGVCIPFLESHARMSNVLPAEVVGRIQVVMFNLGFLPGGDKQLTTRAESTLDGLNSACELLAKGGVLSVVAYPGHDAGKAEAEEVANWMSRLKSDCFEVQQIRAENRANPAPVLWLVMRICETTTSNA